VEILGWLTLLRLDLLGFVLIKAGRGVRARERKWWKVAVALWALHLAVWAIIGVVTMTIRGKISIFRWSWTINFQPWMFLAFAFLGLALTVPFFWLLAPATRRAMTNRPAAATDAAAAQLAASVPALPETPFLPYSPSNKPGGIHDDSNSGHNSDPVDCPRHPSPRPGAL
jgi:hypothetical protein